MIARRKHDEVFELLRTKLGAKVIEVLDSRTGRTLWKKSELTGCGYDSEGIDSESQNEGTRNQGDQR